MSGRWTTVVKAVCGVLLCAVIVCGLWLVGAQVVFHQALPSVFGYAPLTVLSGSMEPALSAGDLVVVHQEETYEVGDVVAFWDDEALTAHRIVAEASEGFATKGDANNAQDGQSVAPGQIAGRMVLALPAVGSVLSFLRTPPGLLLFAVLALLVVALPDLSGRVHQGRERCAE